MLPRNYKVLFIAGIAAYVTAYIVMPALMESLTKTAAAMTPVDRVARAEDIARLEYQ